MARRFYVCDVVGTGTKADPYRPKVAGAGRNVSALIPTDGAGVPLRDHCLAAVAATPAVHTTLAALAGVDALPDVGFGQALTGAQRGALISSLAGRGISSSWVASGVTLGEAVRRTGRHYVGAAFNEGHLNARD